MLIKGRDLNQRQLEQVLSTFIYRWTAENEHRERAGKNSSKPTTPLISDHEWVNDRAFHFLKDGSSLSFYHRHCEPEYLA